MFKAARGCPQARNWPDVSSSSSLEGSWRLAAAGGEREDGVAAALQLKGKPSQAWGSSAPGQLEGHGGQVSLPFSARAAGLLSGPVPHTTLEK